jgi:iron(III) transport system substrate-binding protein
MILCIADVLDAEGVAAVRKAVAEGRLVDGASTAGWSARLVKKNEQLEPGPATRPAQQRVAQALASNQAFAAAVLPKRIAAPQFMRYGPGMAYGPHVDNAVMGEGEARLRTDVAVTVFLSAPADYDGGELVIDAAGGEESYKLAAGTAVVYPATTLHRVNPVTRGTREVAVTWVQSLVRSAERREVLFDLERARRALFETARRRSSTCCTRPPRTSEECGWNSDSRAPAGNQRKRLGQNQVREGGDRACLTHATSCPDACPLRLSMIVTCNWSRLGYIAHNGARHCPLETLRGWSHMISRKSVVAATVALAFGLLAGAPAYAQITIYNAQHESLTKAWIEAFTKETGIKATYRQGSDLELGNTIVQEGRNSPADVFLTENSPAMTLVDNAGLFAPLEAATLALVPLNYRASNGRWTGIAARSTVFVYNKAKLPADQLPRSLMDLASPAWKGRWGASPSGADFQAIVSAVLDIKGEEATAAWLKGMKTNSSVYRGNGAVMRAVNAGEIDGGVIYHYYYFQDQARTGEGSNNSALHFFRNEDPGAFVSVSGGGVLASSKNMAQAQQFLRWVVSKPGQDILRTSAALEYTVGNGIESAPALPPLKTLGAPEIDPAKLNSKKVTELMIRAGLL